MPRLRLISSPVVKNEGFTLTNSSEENTIVERKPELRAGNSYSSSQSGPVDKSDSLPKFVKHEESTNIELFYDLFFVANLTTFSSVHDINSKKALTSYMGFFCVLWFTWCQTSLFDIRFVADSWLERIAKACHLGVMVGLAVVGPNYDTTGEKEASFRALQTMALILSVSRLILGLQYLLIGFHIRDYKNTRLPIGLLAGVNALAALVYLIVSFVFKKHEHSYRAFYVIAALEMVFNIAASSRWKVLSFKRTHLVERMSLLTLYILGEGVIDILKCIGELVTNESTWTSATIGLVVSAIASIYMLYMLYFDCLNHKEFGSIRQQIWAFAHFPFHVALVLSLAGIAEFTKWYQVVQISTPFLVNFETKLYHTVGTIDIAPNSMAQLSNQTLAELTQYLNETVSSVFDKYPPKFTYTVVDWAKSINEISQGYGEDDESKKDFMNAAWELISTVLHSVFTLYGFESEEPSTETDSDPSAQAQNEVTADFDAIGVVFVYFFVAAGLTIVLMGFLSVIMDTHRRWGFGTIIRFASHLVVGIIIACLAIMKHQEGEGVGYRFETSPWVLPTYTLAIAFVLAFHHIKWGSRDHEVDGIDYMTEHTDAEHAARHMSS